MFLRILNVFFTLKQFINFNLYRTFKNYIFKALLYISILLSVTASLSSHKPSRGVYDSRSAGVLINKIVTLSNNKIYAL